MGVDFSFNDNACRCNELSQLTKKKEGNESYNYIYDKRGNCVEETGKKESRSYLYDETNRMVEGTNWKGDKSAYTYNGLGLRVGNIQTTHVGKAGTGRESCMSMKM